MSSGIAKCWFNRKGGSLIIVIPNDVREDLKIEAGTKFLITSDKQKRLIFQRIE